MYLYLHYNQLRSFTGVLNTTTTATTTNTNTTQYHYNILLLLPQKSKCFTQQSISVWVNNPVLSPSKNVKCMYVCMYLLQIKGGSQHISRWNALERSGILFHSCVHNSGSIAQPRNERKWTVRFVNDK